jgi:hypothetical protein
VFRNLNRSNPSSDLQILIWGRAVSHRIRSGENSSDVQRQLYQEETTISALATPNEHGKRFFQPFVPEYRDLTSIQAEPCQTTSATYSGVLIPPDRLFKSPSFLQKLMHKSLSDDAERQTAFTIFSIATLDMSARLHQIQPFTFFTRVEETGNVRP